MDLNGPDLLIPKWGPPAWAVIEYRTMKRDITTIAVSKDTRELVGILEAMNADIETSDDAIRALLEQADTDGDIEGMKVVESKMNESKPTPNNNP